MKPARIFAIALGSLALLTPDAKATNPCVSVLTKMRHRSP
jgi:hypothetical protein